MESLSSSSIEGTLLSLSSVVILLAAFACLGSKLFNRYVAYYGFQSVVLSFAAGVVAYYYDSAQLWVLAGLTFAVKGLAIPLTTRSLLLRRLELKRDVALSTGLSTSLIIGALLTTFAYLAIRPADLPHGLVASSVVPLSTAVVLLGALAMVVRRHTVAQLIGWLITENGVFLGAITLVATFPFIVEAGIFLDLVAAVLIMLVFVSGITRRLAEATSSELRELPRVIVLVALVVLLPLTGAFGVAARWHARGAGYSLVAGAAGSFAASIALAASTAGRSPVQGIEGFLYVDPLAVFFAITISLVVLLAAFGSAAYLHAEEDRGELSSFQVRLYFVFFSVFASGMLGSLFAGNLGLLWVLIEASTLASVALVGLEAKARSLEAAWKYVIISSLGVTVALVATLWLFYAGSAVHLTSNERLTWPYLFAHAHALQPGSLRLAFLLAVVGYGTKVGFAPMHTWLPDAHSEAPSPASAMLSAALLNTGMYAVIRFQAIARAGLGSAFPDHVLLVFGFLTLFVGVIFMVRRGNFKRLFAYSSIEHMGIVAVALGFGGVLGLYGALLQVLNHAIGKAVLFLSSGHLVLGYKTRESGEVRGALSALPLAGGVLVLASLAVAGSPPFGVFLSELTIVRAGFAGAAPVLAGLLLVLLVVGFIALVGTTLAMATGDGPEPLSPYPRRSGRILAGLPLVAGLGILALLGLWIPGGLNDILMHAVRAIS